jgi:carboxyl-terminal processing protease
LHKEGLKPDYEVGLPDEYYLKNQPVPRDLEPGDMGEKVMLLQGMLQCLGYQIKLTGVFDEPLLGALKDFQDKNNVPIGVLDDLTRETIRHCLREKADMLDEQLCFALDLLKEQAGLV